MRLQIVPLDLSEANALVEQMHRHHRPVVGHKFSVGVANEGGTVVGAAIVGRPVARRLDDGWTLEVLRCVTDGTKNAPSALYGACARAAFALGYRKVVTYIRNDEPGTSLLASGWKLIASSPGKSWSVPSRPRVDKSPLIPRFRFEKEA